MLKNCIVNINSRVCPTTFILLPIPKQEEQAQQDEAAKKSVLRHLKKIHRAISSPRETLLGLLQEKYYIVLICEVCRQHPEDKELWYLVDKPKEIVGKILPLARAGLQFAAALNKISSLGRIFGLPTPVLDDSTFTDGIEFLNELEEGTLSSYSSLEKVAEENYCGGNGEESKGNGDRGTERGGGGGAGAGGGGAGVSSGDSGYCVREFSLFLSRVDPDKRWAHLSARVSETGDLCYVCPRCLLNSSSS
jgi:uncharacterized membrane protein YgcG